MTIEAREGEKLVTHTVLVTCPATEKTEKKEFAFSIEAPEHTTNFYALITPLLRQRLGNDAYCVLIQELGKVGREIDVTEMYQESSTPDTVSPMSNFIQSVINLFARRNA